MSHPFQFTIHAFGVDTLVWPVTGRHLDGSIAISLMCEGEYGPEPYARCTVQLNKPARPGCVWIKDYSENEGMVEALQAAGIIRLTPVDAVISGFVTIEQFVLTPTFLEFVHTQELA